MPTGTWLAKAGIGLFCAGLVSSSSWAALLRGQSSRPLSTTSRGLTVHLVRCPAAAEVGVCAELAPRWSASRRSGERPDPSGGGRSQGRRRLEALIQTAPIASVASID